MRLTIYTPQHLANHEQARIKASERLPVPSGVPLGYSFSYPSEWPLVYISSGEPLGTGHHRLHGMMPRCSLKVPVIVHRRNVYRLSSPVISQTMSIRHPHIRHEAGAMQTDTR